MKAKEMVLVIQQSPEYQEFLKRLADYPEEAGEEQTRQFDEVIKAMETVRKMIIEYKELFYKQIAKSYRSKNDQPNLLNSAAYKVVKEAMEAFDRQVAQQLPSFEMLYNKFKDRADQKVKEVKA